MKKKILLAFMLFLGIFGLVSCSLESVTSISLESGFKQEWAVGEELDKASLKIIATMDGGTTQELNGDTAGVSISGFDTTTAGEKTLTIQYEGVSVSASYLVIGVENLAKNSAELVAMIETKVDVISLKPGVVYDLGKTPIASSIAIRTYGSSAVSKAILKNVNVNFLVATAQSITFSNIKFTNDGLDGAIILSVHGGKKEEAKDKVQFNNCEFEGISYTSTGLKLDGNLDYKFMNCNFVTPGEDDVFDTMIHLSACFNRSKENNLITGCNLTCRFAYAFQGICGTSFISNTVSSTLKFDEHFTDSTGANLVKVKKNPVLFHAETSYNDGKLDLLVTDNELSNLENLFRIYNVDGSTETVEQGLTFSGNNLKNIAVLVRYSSSAYTKDFAARILASNATMKNGEAITTAYAVKSDFVIMQNTAVSVTNPEVNIVDETLTVYKGFVYQEKYTTDEAHQYNYVALYNKVKVLQKGSTYYSITIRYSADGLDSREIVEIVDAATIAKLNEYVGK